MSADHVQPRRGTDRNRLATWSNPWLRGGCAPDIGGAVGLLPCVLGALFDSTQFFRSYLIAFLFSLGIGLGSLAPRPRSPWRACPLSWCDTDGEQRVEAGAGGSGFAVHAHRAGKEVL